MTLAEYIKQLKEQGISREEAIPLIIAFKENNGQIPEQTIDENFQQDGVAGADAPSVSVAPQNTELSLENISLDLEDVQSDTDIGDPEMIFKEKYNTPLTKEEKIEYDAWVAAESKRQGRDITWDLGTYDIQGFWKSGDHMRMDKDNHGSDKWKKPNHPTFSNQSKYHNVDGYVGGTWAEDGGYTPSAYTAKLYDKNYYDRLFGREPNRPEYLKTTELSNVSDLDSLLNDIDKKIKRKPLSEQKIADIKSIESRIEPTKPDIEIKQIDKQRPLIQNFRSTVEGVLANNGIYQLGVEGRTVKDLINNGVEDELVKQVKSDYKMFYALQDLPFDFTMDNIIEKELSKLIKKERDFFNTEKNKQVDTARKEGVYQPTIDQGFEDFVQDLNKDQKTYALLIQEARKYQKQLKYGDAKDAQNNLIRLKPLINDAFEKMQQDKYGRNAKEYSYLFDPTTGAKLDLTEAIESSDVNDQKEEVERLEQEYNSLSLELLEREFFRHNLDVKNNQEDLLKTIDLKPNDGLFAIGLGQMGYVPQNGVFKNVRYQDLLNYQDQRDLLQQSIYNPERGIVPVLGDELKLIAEERLQLGLEREALTSSYILNVDPASIKIKASDYVERFGETVLEATFGEDAISRIGTTKRKELDQLETLFNNANIELTEEQKENFERGFGMKVVEGVGYFVPELAKFAVANKVAGATGITRYIAQLAKGSTRDRLMATALGALLEEAKFEAVTAGEAKTGGGAGFFIGGKLAGKFIPKFTGKAAAANNIIEKYAGGAIGGVGGSEAAKVAEAFFEDLIGGKDFKKAMHEIYGDMNEATERILVEGVTFGILGVQRAKAKDFYSIRRKRQLLENIESNIIAGEYKGAELNRKINLAQDLKRDLSYADKPFNDLNIGEQQKQVNNFREIIQNPESTIGDIKEAQRFINRYEANVAAAQRNINKSFNNLTQAGVMKNLTLNIQQGGLSPGNKAEFDPVNRTIRVDINQYKPGVLAQEVGHVFMKAAFNSNTKAASIFKERIQEDVNNALKDQTFNVGDKTGLSFEQAIKEAYKEKPATTPEEYVMNVVEFLSQPKYRELLLQKGLINNLKRSTLNIANRVGLDYTNKNNFRTGAELLEFLYSVNKVAEGGSSAAIKNKFKAFEEIIIDGTKLKDLANSAKEMSSEEATVKASPQLEALKKNSNEIQKIFTSNESLERIKELDIKNEQKTITDAEKAEKRSLKTKDYGKVLPYYKNYIDILANTNYKSVQEQAYTKEDFKSDLGVELSNLMNTYRIAEGVQFNKYIYDNLHLRIPKILEDFTSKEFTKELSDAAGQTIDAEITEAIDANNKVQEEAVKTVIDPVKELGSKGFEVVETQELDGTVKKKRVQKEVSNLDKVTTVEEVTTKTYRGVKEQIGGRVAKEFFGIDPQKATDIKHDKDGKPVRDSKGKLVRVSANLTSEGFGSEARKIQDIIQDYSKFKRLMKIINPKNVSSEIAELTPPGETVARKIDVSRDTYGIATGIKNNMLNLFMNKTGVRSKGQTSQVEVRELKPELLNITPELHKSFIRDNFGVTGKGEANIYNKAVGQNLKGFIDMISGSIANKYYRDKIIREQGGFANNEQLLADIAAGKPVTMASKSILDRAFKQFDLTEREIEKIYKSTNPNIFQTKDPVLFEKYQNVLAFSRKQASDLAELNNIKLFNEAGIISNKIVNKDKFITGEDSSRVDHHVDIKDAKNNDLKIGIEAKYMGGPTGARYGQFTIKPEFDPKTNEPLNVKIDLSRPQLTGEPKKALLKEIDAFAELVFKVSNGKEKYDKHRAIISKSTKIKLEKFKKQFKTIEGDINDITNSYNSKEKDGYKGNYAFMTLKDGSIDVYSFGPDKYNTEAEPLNGTPQLETRIKLNELTNGNFTINLIAEYRLKPDNIKNKTKLNIKNAQELVDKFVDPISKNSFASKNINSLTSSDIMREIEFADVSNMRDIVAGRLFSEQFKNKPSRLQNFSNLNLKQQQAVLKEMAKADLTTSKFNNRLLPESERLTGEFTNDQVLEKIKELDAANDNNFTFASKELNSGINDMIERSRGIPSTRVVSQTEAIMEGRSKGRFDIFIRPQAEDFIGLLYKMLGKGEQGNADMAFFKRTLLDPFAKGIANISADRISLLSDYKALVSSLKVPGETGVKGLFKKPTLKKQVGDTGFTAEQAVRAYIWTKQGMEVPGLSESQLKKLLLHVKENKELITFGNQLIRINKGDGYVKPSENWLSGTIGTDILEGLNTTKRSKYLEAWQKNVDVMFSPDNLNKLQAAYGKPYVDAMKDVLRRMKTGRNRIGTGDTITQRFTDFIAQATGSIMFLNSRSAVLQTISSLNFINFGDNNIFAAGKAFANQKQYWKDFTQLFNSDFLKDRRAGLRINVIERDIATAARRGGIRGVTARLLQAGFTPTQIADSFAIAAGGSTFYRNRIKTYEKETDVDGNKIYTKEQAEQKAFQDFRENAEESQQSSRPDKISAEQASGLGRHVLAFANTPAQYARIIKKAALDLKNGRGDAKTNISKIVYYTFAQNVIFNTLQQAIFATVFDDDLEVTEDKAINLANGMSNSLLRGMGVYPAVFAAIKDAAIKLYTEKQKKKPEFEKAAIQLLNITPPVGSKYRKIAGGLKSFDFTTTEAALEKGFSLDNPAIRGAARATEGLTNLPLDRLLIKLDNIQGALDQDNEVWQRIAMGLGWQDWQLGIKDEKEKKKATGGFRKTIERKEIEREEILR